ncbi:universal stress protein [Melioribacter sp. OK-6-Me]|uniref:universal stress protein n=1 Tax=unclassified Melioribacter TaxID=2627329 RepID=UPI003ED8C093
MVKKIGLAVTFSPNGLSLLKNAHKLAQLFGAELVVIHVGEKNSDKEIKMNELIREAGLKEGDYLLIWQMGEPADTIIDVCIKEKVDLLVSGALEKEPLLKYYTGSVARTLMRGAPCSVLVLVNPENKIIKFNKICVGVDYTPLSEIAVKKAYKLALLEKAEEFILVREFQVPGLAITISDGGNTEETESKRLIWQKEEEMKLKLFAEELNLTEIKPQLVCRYGKEGWELKQFAQQAGCDLLVVALPSNKLKFFDRIFKHDIEFIFSQLPCSLLIIR